MYKLMLNNKEQINLNGYYDILHYLDKLFIEKNYFNILNPLNFEPIDFYSKIKIYEFDHLIDLCELENNTLYINF